ncbi:MAG: protein kinase [Candidatus Aminicenantes bacterium]|nr:protein kinase [Candidatus Aminicenantes bacterium]
MTTQCLKCQSKNPDDSKFCKDCGEPLKPPKKVSVTKTFQTPLKEINKETVIAGKYKIIEKIGEGGMGQVYKAKDTRLDRMVALKFLPPDLTKDPEAKKRFLQEARAAAALDHPHICTIYEVDEAEGQTFISMSYIQGQNLKDKLKEGPLDINRAKDIALQVAEGLRQAHEKGIIHRDIKPANIMLTEKGQAKITDFGLAKLTGGADLTKTSTVMGTAAYMSPEQARGDKIDHRTDIWSLGAMFYEMLSGKAPFQREREQASIFALLNDKPTPLSLLRSDIPVHIETVIEKAMAKNASKRHRKVSDFIQDLKTSQADSPPKTEKSIAVLPFVNMSAEKDNEYFSDGLTEEIITDLSKIQSLRVISRTSAMMLKGTKKSMKTIGQELDVQYVLEGSVRKAGNKLRITAQLINASSDAHLWADKYSGTLDDVFDIQEKVSQSIVKALKLKLTSGETQGMVERPIKNIQAYEYYLRGRFAYASFTKEGLDQAKQYYEAGLKITDGNALLYAALGNVYLEYARIWIKQEDALDKAEEYAQRALGLDPETAQAYTVLALSHYMRGITRDMVRLLKKGYSIDPNDIILIQYLGWSYIIKGKTSKAFPLANRIIKLDPINPISGFLSVVLFYQGKFKEAAEAGDKFFSDAMLEIPFVRFYKSLFLVFAGKEKEALDILEPIEQISISDIYIQNARLLKYVLQGKKNRIRDLMDEEFILAEKRDAAASCWAASFFAMLRDFDSAVDWLKNSIDLGFINYPYMSQYDPFLSKMKGDPRYEKLMERVKHEWENFGV